MKPPAGSVPVSLGDRDVLGDVRDPAELVFEEVVRRATSWEVHDVTRPSPPHDTVETRTGRRECQDRVVAELRRAPFVDEIGVDVDLGVWSARWLGLERRDPGTGDRRADPRVTH